MNQQIPPGTVIVEPMHEVFHELHADGRHALCAVCGPPIPATTSAHTASTSRG